MKKLSSMSLQELKLALMTAMKDNDAAEKQKIAIEIKKRQKEAEEKYKIKIKSTEDGIKAARKTYKDFLKAMK